MWHQLWRGLEVLIWQTLHLKWSDLISCYKVWSHVSNYYTKLYRFLSVVHENILRLGGIGSQSAVSWIIAMVTMPIHIWLPGAAWHHRHGQSVTMREHGTEYWVRPGSGQADTISALKDGAERTLGFLSDLIATYIIGAGPTSSHIMTLDARYNMNFMHLGRIWQRRKQALWRFFLLREQCNVMSISVMLWHSECLLQHFMHLGRIWPREKSWLRKGFARSAGKQQYLSYQFCWRISCSKSNRI